MERIELAKHTVKNMLQSLQSLGATLDGKDRPAALVAAGKVFEMANYYASSEASYAEAHNANPANHEAHARLAIARLKLGLNLDALKTIGELIDKAPQFKFRTLDEKPTSVLTVLGDALAASGNLAGAATAYKQAIELVPEDGYAVGRRAELLLQLGDLSAAQLIADRIPDHDLFSIVRSTLRLTKNDPAILPAILGIRQGIQLMSRV
jgi:tetratricopeptide (TPR) repeat protein